MKPLLTSSAAFTVTFPSPFVSPFECNNTVHCEYFMAKSAAPPSLAVKRPAVVVLHILDGKFVAERLVCGCLAASGTNALLLKMPFYGPRRPPEWKGQMTDDIEVLYAGLKQAIMDTRRAAEWLASRPEVDPKAIGLCGISLGGFVAATAAGVDGNFPRVVIVLAGGDLVKVLDNRPREVVALRELAEKRGYTTARLQELLHPVEPLTFASRLKKTKMLMINGKEDEVVPEECSQALADASGAKLKWFEATHYTLVEFLPTLLQEVAEFFAVSSEGR
jgi:dienelactone hydrolase